MRLHFVRFTGKNPVGNVVTERLGAFVDDGHLSDLLGAHNGQ